MMIYHSDMKQVTIKKEGGRVDMDGLAACLSTMRNGVYDVVIKKRTEQRSISQNALLWLWMKCIERETGTPKDDCYFYYCKKFLTKMIIIGQRMEYVYETSSQLDTKKMSEFLDKIQADALMELGINLPNPQDRYFESFYQEFK